MGSIMESKAWPIHWYAKIYWLIWRCCWCIIHQQNSNNFGNFYS